MIITNAKYLIPEFGDNTPNMIKADWNGVTHWVPLDLDNTDYAEIMRQVDAGELTIEPADE